MLLEGAGQSNFLIQIPWTLSVLPQHQTIQMAKILRQLKLSYRPSSGVRNKGYS